MLDIDKIRQDFPILHQQVQGHQLVYFDNAATSQKPKVVIDALTGYYEGYNANIHRGIHTLAEKATLAFESTRETVKQFINAGSLEEVIFTKGTTEAINLVATSYGRKFIKAGDEIIISTLEHHANIVPWQMLCEETGAKLRVIPINELGELDMEAFEKMLSEKTKFVSIVHISNALGTINPVEKIIKAAHQVGAVVLIDGAQSAPHLSIDVQAMDCDFYIFSAHKVYAPTGMGVLYGKKALLEVMPPYLTGGEMIKEVSFEKTTFNVLPYKFEAGTPNIADTIALKYALDYVQSIGKEDIAVHENQLAALATSLISNIKGLKLIGRAAKKASIVSFVVEGVHHLDMGMLLDAQGIAVRTGHHCTQPLMKRLGIEGTVRASFAVYNTKAEVEYFAKKLEEVVEKLR
jgi:cysteine desulfurase / selenocysteine lyase